jgi:hypothetical protein
MSQNACFQCSRLWFRKCLLVLGRTGEVAFRVGWLYTALIMMLGSSSTKIGREFSWHA